MATNHKLIVMVVYELDAVLPNHAIDTLNSLNGTRLPYGTTYIQMYYSRINLNSERGYFRKQNGRDVWVVPQLDMGFVSTDKSVVEFLTVEEFTKLEFDQEPENL